MERAGVAGAPLRRGDDRSVTWPPTANPNDVRVVAHRGFAGAYPENTLAAVRRACVEGADAVEVDVLPSGDGDVVVLHDSTPARVTDASGSAATRPVWETPLDDLRDLSVLGTGEPVPLLREVVDVVPPEVDLFVELKNPGSGEVRFDERLPEAAVAEQRAIWRPFARRVLDVLSTGDHDVVVSSFCEGALAAVRDVAPDVPLAAVCSNSVDDVLGIARRHDCELLHVPRNMVTGATGSEATDYADGPYDGEDVVAAAREDGRAVTAWTVENWHQAADLRRAGVDGIVADYPGLLDGAAVQRGSGVVRDETAGD